MALKYKQILCASVRAQLSQTHLAYVSPASPVMAVRQLLVSPLLKPTFIPSMLVIVARQPWSPWVTNSNHIQVRFQFIPNQQILKRASCIPSTVLYFLYELILRLSGGFFRLLYTLVICMLNYRTQMQLVTLCMTFFNMPCKSHC